MKYATKFAGFFAALLILAGCSSSRQTTGSLDDVYYNPDNEEHVAAYNNYAQSSVPEDNRTHTPNPDAEDYYYQDQQTKRETYERYDEYDEEEGNTIINNNNYYYEHNDPFYYSNRIRRFSGPSLGFGYYDPFYSPWYYSSRPGWSLSFSFGYDPYWHDPWYRPSYYPGHMFDHHFYGPPFGHSPYYGYNPYNPYYGYNPYSYGYYDPYYSGYNNGWNTGYWGNKGDNSTPVGGNTGRGTMYGPRGNTGTNVPRDNNLRGTGNNGRVDKESRPATDPNAPRQDVPVEDRKFRERNNDDVVRPGRATEEQEVRPQEPTQRPTRELEPSDIIREREEQPAVRPNPYNFDPPAREEQEQRERPSPFFDREQENNRFSQPERERPQRDYNPPRQEPRRDYTPQREQPRRDYNPPRQQPSRDFSPPRQQRNFEQPAPSPRRNRGTNVPDAPRNRGPR